MLGLVRNPAFLTSTLGMAAMTFSLGGIQVWMPQFLYSERHYTLEAANLTFGLIIVADGIVAALAGGWLGDYLLRRMKSSYYLVSAASMALGVPVMIVALFVKGRAMIPAIALAAFFLLLNTAPLNAAVINSVDAHIRATALAVNIFIIHILGDVPSPTDDGLGCGPALAAGSIRPARHRHGDLICHTVLRDEIRAGGERRRP